MSLCEVYVRSGLELRLGSRKVERPGVTESHILVKLRGLQIVETGSEGRDWGSKKG